MDIESAWPANPDYVIDLVPLPFTARVWVGDVLVAESTSCLRLEETRHVDRLYFPESDVKWEHFEESVAHTICPFKGEASYWTLTAGDAPEKNVVWTYREPFDEVAGIKGYVAFYQERLRIELVEEWPGEGALATTTNPFPTWGDAADLVRLVDVEPVGDGHFVGPPYRDVSRNVVEGGQMLAQAIVAAAKTFPDQRVDDCAHDLLQVGGVRFAARRRGRRTPSWPHLLDARGQGQPARQTAQRRIAAARRRRRRRDSQLAPDARRRRASRRARRWLSSG